MQFEACSVQCAMCSVLCAVCSVHWLHCAVLCVVCCVFCCLVCSVQCAVCSVQSRCAKWVDIWLEALHLCKWLPEAGIWLSVSSLLNAHSNNQNHPNHHHHGHWSFGSSNWDDDDEKASPRYVVCTPVSKSHHPNQPGHSNVDDHHDHPIYPNNDDDHHDDHEFYRLPSAPPPLPLCHCNYLASHWETEATLMMTMTMM